MSIFTNVIIVEDLKEDFYCKMLYFAILRDCEVGGGPDLLHSPPLVSTYFLIGKLLEKVQ